MKFHHEKIQATCDLPPGDIIYVDELALLGLEGVVPCTRDMFLQNVMKGPAELPETNLVSIYKGKVTGLVQIDGVELRVLERVEGGRLVSHKSPIQGTYFIM